MTLFCVLTVSSQTSNAQEPKEKPDFRAHELQLGVNLVRLGRDAFGKGLNTGEVQGSLGLHNYLLALDIGSEKNTRGEDYTYVSDGNYFRLGVDYNFVKDKFNGNIMSLGLRYARAYFDETLNYTYDDGFGFGEQTVSRQNSDTKARWAELAFNLRGKVVSNLYMGMTLRWQVLRKVSGDGELQTYDVPGYGNTKRKNSTQFDYYLAWRLPIREKK